MTKKELNLLVSVDGLEVPVTLVGEGQDRFIPSFLQRLKQLGHDSFPFEELGVAISLRSNDERRSLNVLINESCSFFDLRTLLGSDDEWGVENAVVRPGGFGGADLDFHWLLDLADVLATYGPLASLPGGVIRAAKDARDRLYSARNKRVRLLIGDWRRTGEVSEELSSVVREYEAWYPHEIKSELEITEVEERSLFESCGYRWGRDMGSRREGHWFKQ